MTVDPTLAPIVVFAYRRADHLQRTLAALAANPLADQSQLIVYCDGPGNAEAVDGVGAVRRLVRSMSGFGDVEYHFRDENIGLANSVITGVSETIERFGHVIVMEDDVVSSRHFLQYMNKALAHYRQDRPVFSITGYCYPPSRFSLPDDYRHSVFLSHRAASWSWGTWADRWSDIDWGIEDFSEFLTDDKEIAKFSAGGGDLVDMLASQLSGNLDSWAIRYCYAQFKARAYCVYPRKSFVHNIGFGSDATHCTGSSKGYDVELDDDWQIDSFPDLLRPDPEIVERFRGLFPQRPIDLWRNRLLGKQVSGEVW